MANLKELAQDLRKLHAKNDNNDLEKKIKLCFEMMELYSRIGKNYRIVSDEKNCYYAALILSGIVQKGLATKVIDFFKKFQLPERAVQLLQSNLIRMETY